MKNVSSIKKRTQTGLFSTVRDDLIMFPPFETFCISTTKNFPFNTNTQSVQYLATIVYFCINQTLVSSIKAINRDTVTMLYERSAIISLFQLNYWISSVYSFPAAIIPQSVQTCQNLVHTDIRKSRQWYTHDT